MAIRTETGSAPVQGRLWSTRADDWAEFQEMQVGPAYTAAFDALGVGAETRLLDAGCGAGGALRLAADRGADVAGLDASEGLLAHARRRVPGARIEQGDLESLPFDHASFDVVTGFNSFQYAARPAAALAEAVRVLGPAGRVLLLTWGPPETCEAAGYLAALGRLMPPPPPGAAGPFALSGKEALEQLLRSGGLRVVGFGDVETVWSYPDEATALAGLLASGPVVVAIEHAGEPAVRQAVIEFLEPFRTAAGGYQLTNVFRYAIGTPEEETA
jgi:SAM-dependent methyltransferase